MIHQPVWLACGEPGPDAGTGADATAAPTTATPSVAPIWRLVDATAAATPAWLRGMPDTAVLVIGAFTMPKPMPKTR